MSRPGRVLHRLLAFVYRLLGLRDDCAVGLACEGEAGEVVECSAAIDLFSPQVLFALDTAAEPGSGTVIEEVRVGSYVIPDSRLATRDLLPGAPDRVQLRWHGARTDPYLRGEDVSVPAVANLVVLRVRFLAKCRFRAALFGTRPRAPALFGWQTWQIGFTLSGKAGETKTATLSPGLRFRGEKIYACTYSDNRHDPSRRVTLRQTFVGPRLQVFSTLSPSNGVDVAFFGPGPQNGTRLAVCEIGQDISLVFHFEDAATICGQVFGKARLR